MMGDAVILLVLIVLGVGGYFLMSRMDRFLNTHVKGDDEEGQIRQRHRK